MQIHNTREGKPPVSVPVPGPVSYLAPVPGLVPIPVLLLFLPVHLYLLLLFLDRFLLLFPYLFLFLDLFPYLELFLFLYSFLDLFPHPLLLHNKKGSTVGIFLSPESFGQRYISTRHQNEKEFFSFCAVRL
ncbi:hypothetical protein NQ318_014962 [Aromia moschata]|uniref:Uncharacterized protein n=1 Tax=Aromia moschata TaxID=1265417 RepID=A0AAV8YZ74_9CUCU|nr:hypothetical protein NQ318_014962 [Aromia moschata]